MAYNNSINKPRVCEFALVYDTEKNLFLERYNKNLKGISLFWWKREKKDHGIWGTISRELREELGLYTGNTYQRDKKKRHLRVPARSIVRSFEDDTEKYNGVWYEARMFSLEIPMWISDILSKRPSVLMTSLDDLYNVDYIFWQDREKFIAKIERILSTL